MSLSFTYMVILTSLQVSCWVGITQSVILSSDSLIHHLILCSSPRGCREVGEGDFISITNVRWNFVCVTVHWFILLLWGLRYCLHLIGCVAGGLNGVSSAAGLWGEAVLKVDRRARGSLIVGLARLLAVWQGTPANSVQIKYNFAYPVVHLYII